jgi:hypothetical protein
MDFRLAWRKVGRAETPVSTFFGGSMTLGISLLADVLHVFFVIC